MSEQRIDSLGIDIKTADFEASRKFYESLGFKPVFGYGDEDFRKTLPAGVGSAPEKYRGLTFQISDTASLEIAEGHIAIKDQAVFKDLITSPKVSAMVKVPTLVPLFSNPRVNINFPVRHYYWGTIEAAFRDPDGFALVFIAPFSDKEVAELSKFVKVEEITP